MTSNFLDPNTAAHVINKLSNIDLVVVGGQAVMFWAKHYGLQELTASLTRDVDFLSSIAQVEEADLALANIEHSTKVATMEDYTPNAGVIMAKVDGSEVRIDFLSTLHAIGTVDARERALSIKTAGLDKPIKVMHPFLCMESKIANLGYFPEKRDAAGLEQARLGIEIAREHTLRELSKPSESQQRSLLKIAQRLRTLSKTDAACFSFTEFGLDVFQSFPLDLVESREFHSLGWSQIQAEAGLARVAMQRRLERVEDPSQIARMRFSG